jgi:hypothetical protein
MCHFSRQPYGKAEYMTSESMHHTIFMIDVQGSATLTNPQKLAMRETLRAVVTGALAFAGITGGARLEDRGDGLLGTLTAEVPKVRLIGAAVTGLDRGLSASATGIRARLGIHCGEVHSDAWGIAGSDVELACRLADAPVARRTLAAARHARLAVVVSEPVHDSVVRHGGPHLFPEQYARVTVRLKEVDRQAWLHLPGYATPPVPPAEEAPPAGPRSGPPAGRRIDFHGPGSYVENSTIHGGLHVGALHPGERR